MGTKMTNLLREAWLRWPSQRKAGSQGVEFFPRPACNRSNTGYRGMTCQRYEDEQKNVPALMELTFYCATKSKPRHLQEVGESVDLAHSAWV